MKASFFIILLFVTLASYSQEETKTKWLSIETGLSIYAIKDLTQSPYTLSQASVPIKISYSSQNEKRIQGFEILFDSFNSSGPIESPQPAGVVNIEGIYGILSYHWLKSIGWTPLQSKVSVGGVFQTSVFSRYTNFRFFDPQNTGELISTISPRILITKPAGDNSFNWEFTLPIFTYNLASSYNPRFTRGDVNKSQVLFWNKMLDVQSSLFYSIQKKTIMDFGYAYRYYQYNKGIKVQVARHQIFTRISFGL